MEESSENSLKGLQNVWAIEIKGLSNKLPRV